MKNIFLIYLITFSIFACDNNNSVQQILREDGSFKVFNERYSYDKFSGLFLDAVSKDGSMSVWHGVIKSHDDKSPDKKCARLFLTRDKNTDLLICDKNFDEMEKVAFVNEAVFIQGYWEHYFGITSLKDGLWNIQKNKMPFFTCFYIDQKSNTVYFSKEKGIIQKYSLEPFEEIQSQVFNIPCSFVHDMLLLNKTHLLCYVMLHGMYHFNLVTTETRSMGKYYEGGFKKADNSHYMLAMFHKCTNGCWNYKKELRVLNLRKGNSKKRFFIEWSISDKNRNIGRFNFLPNQDDYFLVAYSYPKRGCSIYSFKSRAKIARIYTEKTIERFWFPTDNTIMMYLGDLKTQCINFPALIAEYNKQNDNEKKRIVVGLKYPLYSALS